MPKKVKLYRLDPPGCDCADCESGASKPVDQASQRQLRKLSKGKLVNETGGWVKVLYEWTDESPFELLFPKVSIQRMPRFTYGVESAAPAVGSYRNEATGLAVLHQGPIPDEWPLEIAWRPSVGSNCRYGQCRAAAAATFLYPITADQLLDQVPLCAYHAQEFQDLVARRGDDWHRSVSFTLSVNEMPRYAWVVRPDPNDTVFGRLGHR